MSIVSQGYGGQAIVSQGYGSTTLLQIEIGVNFNIDISIKVINKQSNINFSTAVKNINLTDTFDTDTALKLQRSNTFSTNITLKKITYTNFRMDVALSFNGEIISPDELEWVTEIIRDSLFTLIER